MISGFCSLLCLSLIVISSFLLTHLLHLLLLLFQPATMEIRRRRPRRWSSMHHSSSGCCIPMMIVISLTLCLIMSPSSVAFIQHWRPLNQALRIKQEQGDRRRTQDMYPSSVSSSSSSVVGPLYFEPEGKAG